MKKLVSQNRDEGFYKSYLFSPPHTAWTPPTSHVEIEGKTNKWVLVFGILPNAQDQPISYPTLYRGCVRLPGIFPPLERAGGYVGILQVKGMKTHFHLYFFLLQPWKYLMIF